MATNPVLAAEDLCKRFFATMALDHVVFLKGLGTMGDRVDRLVPLARKLAVVLYGRDTAEQAERAAGQMGQVPLVRHAVLGRVHAHRRHRHPVRHHEISKLERRKHGWTATLAPRRRGGG